MVAEVAQAGLGVFTPTNKPLVVRGTLGNVFDETKKKKARSNSRLLREVPTPALPPIDSNLNLPFRGSGSGGDSKSSSPRFGSYSQASFFSRHNPHPSRVRHIKGLNGIPICAVHDQGFFPVARFNLSNMSPMQQQSVLNRHFPSNAIGINSTIFPIDTITGLQNYPYKEKAVPRLGLIPIVDSWREELKELCNKAGLVPDEPAYQPPKRPATTGNRQTVYSANTGRLIPPPSRMSGGGSRMSNRGMPSYNHISSYPDTETLMLEMLCQILQTDSIQAVQQWLVSAGDREKSLVLDVIKAAIDEEDKIQQQAAATPDRSYSAVPPAVVKEEGEKPDTELELLVPTAEDRALSRASSRRSVRSMSRPLGTVRKGTASATPPPATPVMRYSKTPLHSSMSRPLSAIDEVEIAEVKES